MLSIPNTSFILCGILWRRYAHLILLLLTLSVHRALADSTDQYYYNVGEYVVECPGSNWLNVDAKCFRIVDKNVYSWNEAVSMCAKPM